MRGSDQRGLVSLFSYVDLERRVPWKDHPLRAIRTIVDVALSALSGAGVRGDVRASGPALDRTGKAAVRALLLQAFYTVRSERQLMERLEFDLLFRWFVGLGIDDRVWDHSGVPRRTGSGFWRRRIKLPGSSRPFSIRARSGSFLSDEHFSVDGTLVEAWAEPEELQAQEGQGWRRKPPASSGRNEEVDFRGEKRSNQ